MSINSPVGPVGDLITYLQSSLTLLLQLQLTESTPKVNQYIREHVKKIYSIGKCFTRGGSGGGLFLKKTDVFFYKRIKAYAKCSYNARFNTPYRFTVNVYTGKNEGIRKTCFTI